MCKLSIIVPIYNASIHLEKCIESILKKENNNIEIIAINDGSTDNSEEIIKKYIRKISKQNCLL